MTIALKETFFNYRNCDKSQCWDVIKNVKQGAACSLKALGCIGYG